jgi:hypothetical protein
MLGQSSAGDCPAPPRAGLRRRIPGRPAGDTDGHGPSPPPPADRDPPGNPLVPKPVLDGDRHDRPDQMPAKESRPVHSRLATTHFGPTTPTRAAARPCNESRRVAPKLTHVRKRRSIPVQPEQLNRFKANVHTHLHTHALEDPRYVNVSAERVNLTPVPMEWVRERIGVTLLTERNSRASRMGPTW